MSVAGNIQNIEERIASACLRSGRKRDEITLMGVTKFQPLPVIEEAYNTGIRFFGESRVSEAAEKFAKFSDKFPDAALHMVGSLQRNKVKQAVSLFDCIQSLDREELAKELAKHAVDGGCMVKPVQILLEFRTGEDSKNGFTGMNELFRTVELVQGFPLLNIRGLMTMAPFTSDELPVRAAFRKLMNVRQELDRRFPESDWSCLSMGMSGDFEIAVEEGSTLLRIGTAIFGERI